MKDSCTSSEGQTHTHQLEEVLVFAVVEVGSLVANGCYLVLGVYNFHCSVKECSHCKQQWLGQPSKCADAEQHEVVPTVRNLCHSKRHFDTMTMFEVGDKLNILEVTEQGYPFWKSYLLLK